MITRTRSLPPTAFAVRTFCTISSVDHTRLLSSRWPYNVWGRSLVFLDVDGSSASIRTNSRTVRSMLIEFPKAEVVRIGDYGQRGRLDDPLHPDR